MQVVLGGGVWPIGQLIGFVEAPFDVVVEAMRNWKRELRARWRERAFVDVPVLDELESLAPLQAPWTRELLIETTGSWTAHVSNALGGGDSWPRVSYLGDVLETQWVVASHTPPEQYPFPSTQLWIGGPEGAHPVPRGPRHRRRRASLLREGVSSFRNALSGSGTAGHAD